VDAKHRVERIDELFSQRFLTDWRFLSRELNGMSYGDGEHCNCREIFSHRVSSI
jgi:hypothetical protein